jgi:hypothetical protein
MSPAACKGQERFMCRWLPETKGLSVEEAVSVFDRPADAKQAAASGARIPRIRAGLSRDD